MASNRRAIFLDKDGTVTYPIFWEKKFRASRFANEVFYYQGVPEMLKQIKKINYKIFMITNQPDLGAGKIQKDKYQEIKHRILTDLEIDEILTCSHVQMEKCKCRKPAPGLIEEILDRNNLDLSNSWVIGDRESDIDLGLSLGMRTILVGSSISKVKLSKDTLFFKETAKAIAYIHGLG